MSEALEDDPRLRIAIVRNELDLLKKQIDSDAKSGKGSCPPGGLHIEAIFYWFDYTWCFDDASTSKPEEKNPPRTGGQLSCAGLLWLGPNAPMGPRHYSGRLASARWRTTVKCARP